MGCSRCGQNHQPPRQMPPQPQQRPGAINPASTRTTGPNPTDAIRQAIGSLRYVPR